MSNFLVLLIFVAFNPIKREALKSPFYLSCFNECYSGSCSSTINQYSNERDIQFYSLMSYTSMTNKLCISTCASYGSFLYASTQNW